MTRRIWRADTAAATAIALTATGIAVLPPVPRLIDALGLAVVPGLVWLAVRPAAWIPVFLAAVLLLPPLPVAVGNSGAHPAIAVALVGFYGALLARGEWRARSNPIGTWSFVLAGVMLASVAMALFYSGFEVAAGSAARVLLFAVTPWLFLSITAGPGRALANSGFQWGRMLYACGVASALFAVIDFFFQFPAPAGASPQFIWLDDRVLRRAQGLFYDAGALGNICAFFLVMCAACILLRGPSAVNGWIAAAGALPLAAALVLSYSRAALLNVAAAVIGLLIVRRRDVRWFRVGVLFPLGVVLAAAIAFFAAPAFAQSWSMRLQRTIELATSAMDTAFSGRLSTWDTIGSFIREHPLRVLFGVGYKTLAYSDVLGREVIADNTWLSVLVETGVAGLTALCLLNAAILRATFRAARSSDASAAFFGTWAFAFWVGEMVQMFTADLLTWWRLLPVVFFVIAMAVVRLEEAPA